MRIECPACGEQVTVARFTCALDPPRLRFTCPACDEEVVIESGEVEPERAAGAPEEAAPRETCPKCDGPRGGEEVCPRCGLRYAAWAEGGDREGEGAPVLWKLWNLVEQDFAAVERHEGFIAACEGRRQLAFAAARYQERLREHPEDPVAEKRLKQISALAQVAALVSSRRDRSRNPLRKAISLAIALALFLVVLVMLAPLVLRTFQRGGEQTPATGLRTDGGQPMGYNLKNRPEP